MRRQPIEIHIRGNALPPEPDSRRREYIVEYSEALRVVKTARGWWIFVHAQQFAPSKDTSRNTATLTEGFDVSGNVRVSKRKAVQYITEAYCERIRENANVRLSTYADCLFIG